MATQLQDNNAKQRRGTVFLCIVISVGQTLKANALREVERLAHFRRNSWGSDVARAITRALGWIRRSAGCILPSFAASCLFANEAMEITVVLACRQVGQMLFCKVDSSGTRINGKRLILVLGVSLRPLRACRVRTGATPCLGWKGFADTLRL